jgi:hypothetical protein
MTGDEGLTWMFTASGYTGGCGKRGFVVMTPKEMRLNKQMINIRPNPPIMMIIFL